MSEQDFRDALRRTMDTATAPPPMSDAPVLEAAHRDRRRRRTLWASAGTAAVVAAIAVGVVVVAPSKSGGDGVQVGNQPPGPRSTQDVATPTSANEQTGGSAVAEDDTETLPPGMTDRTQRSGPQHERGVALAVALDDVVTAAGFGAPGDLEGNGDLAGSRLKHDQANYDGKVDGVEKWSYMAATPVTKGSGVGEMIVEVRTVDEQASGCELAPMWGIDGQCREVMVDGKKVGVTSVNHPDQEHLDQVAAYRHDDGTVVYVAQSLDYGFTNHPALTELPFTPQQLATLATDNRFKVTK
ncbi:hypothetical protein [Actinophytocola sp. NPDC049390]|uniref:hypothetical protein n=1 Tax=Actinophytocola sp. NPDC049390 TaxID=3363894 RepID=UPI0037B6CC0E